MPFSFILLSRGEAGGAQGFQYALTKGTCANDLLKTLNSFQLQLISSECPFLFSIISPNHVWNTYEWHMIATTYLFRYRYHSVSCCQASLQLKWFDVYPILRHQWGQEHVYKHPPSTRASKYAPRVCPTPEISSIGFLMIFVIHFPKFSALSNWLSSATCG